MLLGVVRFVFLLGLTFPLKISYIFEIFMQFTLVTILEFPKLYSGQTLIKFCDAA